MTRRSPNWKKPTAPTSAITAIRCCGSAYWKRRRLRRQCRRAVGPQVRRPVPRVPFDAGFQMLLAAGLTPDAAIDALDDETKRTDGKLDLWCNGNRLPRHYIRQSLRFRHNRTSAEIIPLTGVGWEKPQHICLATRRRAGRKAGSAALQPDPTKAPPGRPPEYRSDGQDRSADRHRTRTWQPRICCVHAQDTRSYRRAWKGFPLPSVRTLQERVAMRRRMRGN